MSGSGRIIASSEKEPVGAKASEERVLSLAFPGDYQNLDLTNKTVKFAVTIDSVTEPELPELNEEFFALLDVKEIGLDDFHAGVQKNMGHELCQAIRSRVKSWAMEGLLQANPIEVSKALTDGEMNRLCVQTVQQLGDNIRPDQLPTELFEEQAECRVMLDLIVAEAVKQHEPEADRGRVCEMTKGTALTYQEPEQVVVWCFRDEPRLSKIRSIALGEQVVDTVPQKTTVIGRQVSREEAVKSAEAP